MPLQLGHRLKRTYRFWRYVGQRFWGDNLMTQAAALAFSTALALVPLFTIAISVMAIFPGFQDAVDNIKAGLVSVLVPHMEEAVRDELNNFIDKARTLTGVGVLFLAVTAMLLLHTASGAFDAIFRARGRRSLATRFMIYWTLLTLGPLLLSLAFSLTAGLLSEGEEAIGGLAEYSLNLVRTLLPFIIEWLVFAMVYWLAPSREVRPRDAMAAALVAALLFQVLKAGFALYLVYFAGYQDIYGALAAIPIALIWLQLAWATALFGATIAAALPEWRGGAGQAAAQQR